MQYKRLTMDYKCKVCGNTSDNIPYKVREMMFGTREEFNYFKCPVCGCLQMGKLPADLSKYYPDDYYSFHLIHKKKTWKQRIVHFLLTNALDVRCGNSNWIGSLAICYNAYYKQVYPWIQKEWLNKNTSVLDVGCGDGALLHDMASWGFKHLTGADPFIKDTIHYKNGITVHKKCLEEMSGKFDFIMLHHSFEHMDAPHRTFELLDRLLAPRGTLLIRIPQVDCYAWRKYQTDWFQIDAPRHLFIHTPKSMDYLAKEHGWNIERILYDSTLSQFIISEMYKRNVAMNEKPLHFSDEERSCFSKKALELNALQDGDMACFFLKKKAGQ